MSWEKPYEKLVTARINKKVKYERLSGQKSLCNEHIDNYLLERLIPAGQFSSDYPNIVKKAATFNLYFTSIISADSKEGWRQAIYTVNPTFIMKHLKHIIKTIQISNSDYQIMYDIDYICNKLRSNDIDIKIAKDYLMDSYIYTNAKTVGHPEHYRKALTEVIIDEVKRYHQKQGKVKKLKK